MPSFQELELREELVTAVSNLGFVEPTPIQAEVIPYMLHNEGDLVALAQTGTGKTAAFGLPLLNMLQEQKVIEALVLAPTRELCIQIAKDLKNYAAEMKGVKVVPVYGGESIVTQFRQLDVQPNVLVATPGRLIDLIGRGKVHLDKVKYLVLDEADEMLNMGFQDDIEEILKSVPEERRTLLFSATMPNEIAQIAKKYMKDAKEITVGNRNSGTENVEHHYYVVRAEHRYLALKRIVDVNPDIYGIVFCRTRQETKDVAEKLMADGYNADALHGDLSQQQRDTVMHKFRIHNIQLLVATDVAARGLDVHDLSHVINYNLPDDNEVYTHRSGRTGRANKKGVSVSIVHMREQRRIRELERQIKREFIRQSVPVGMEVCKKQFFHLIDKMEKVEVSEQDIASFMPQVLAKLDYLTKEELIKRFVSLEFNRFAEYYKDAPDINVPENKKERGQRGNGDEAQRGVRVRFKIRLGRKHGITPRELLGIINKVTDDKSISVGDISVDQFYTFFDIFADQAERLEVAFAEYGQRYGLERVKKSVTKDERSEGRRGRRKEDKKTTERTDRKSPKEYGDRGERTDRKRNTDKTRGFEKKKRKDDDFEFVLNEREFMDQFFGVKKKNKVDYGAPKSPKTEGRANNKDEKKKDRRRK